MGEPSEMSDLQQDTREQILDVVMKQIDLHGENSVRMVAVAREIGITEPAIYYHFRNREDMIVSAHVHRFRANLNTTIEPFVEAVANCTTREEFAAVLGAVYTHSYEAGRAEVRALRAELIGASIRRESIRAQLASEIDDSLAASIEALEIARDRGWLAPDIDPRAFALFNLSVISSMVIPELHGDEAVLENWKTIAVRAATGLVLTDGKSAG